MSITQLKAYFSFQCQKLDFHLHIITVKFSSLYLIISRHLIIQTNSHDLTKRIREYLSWKKFSVPKFLVPIFHLGLSMKGTFLSFSYTNTLFRKPFLYPVLKSNKSSLLHMVICKLCFNSIKLIKYLTQKFLIFLKNKWPLHFYPYFCADWCM